MIMLGKYSMKLGAAILTVHTSSTVNLSMEFQHNTIRIVQVSVLEIKCSTSSVMNHTLIMILQCVLCSETMVIKSSLVKR